MDTYQKVAASAFHQIFLQAVKDTSILYFHQLAAKAYHDGIPTADAAELNVYTPEQELEIRGQLREIVMKYHIIHENGIGSRLTPLINNIMNPNDLQQLTDPLLLQIVQGASQFEGVSNFQQALEYITTLEQDTVTEQSIIDSYGNPDEDLEVAIFEDDTVQCACELCESFFEILQVGRPDPDELNPIQLILARNYSLL